MISHVYLVLIYLLAFYLVGSLQSIQIFQKFTTIDLTQLLSKKPNYLMFSNLKSSLLVIGLAFFDFAKAIIPLYGAYIMGMSDLELSYMVIALMLGHYFPIFNRFKGGYGTMVNLASYTALGWPVMFIGAFIWGVAYLVIGYRAIANVVMSLVIPIYIYYLKNAYLLPVVVLSCLIIYRHFGTIVKIRYGYYLPDTNGLLQKYSKDKDFLI